MSGPERAAGRDPLRSVLRIRREAVDDARRALSECLIAETARAAAADCAEAVIGRELELASRLSGTDSTVEAFARWLPLAREMAERARVAHDRAVLETGRARACLAAARAAAKVVEELQARRAAERDADIRRREQHEQDDQSRRTKHPFAAPTDPRPDDAGVAP